MLPLAAKQNLFVTGPRASALAVPGSLAVVATTNGGTGVISLVGLYAQVFNQSSVATTSALGALNQFVTIYADAASVGIVLAPTVAQLPTPSLTAAGTFSASGVYTPNGSNAEAFVIPAGTSLRFEPQAQDSFLAYVGGGSGYLRIYLSSAINA